MYKLFLDDIRKPRQCYEYTGDERYKDKFWVVVTNYDDFVSAINSNGMPYLVSFDHDLADEHYHRDMNDPVKYDKLREKFTHKTGLECVKFLIEYCKNKHAELPECLIHTMNPSGYMSIEREIKIYKWEKYS